MQVSVSTVSGLERRIEVSVPAACTCFDRNGDGAIDAQDAASFIGCMEGPGVPVSRLCDN